jgi:hypothetical protein
VQIGGLKMFLFMYFLIIMGAIYPAGAFLYWFFKYRNEKSLKEFWRDV